MIKIRNSDDYGTGFFYNFLDQTYIITNRHVMLPVNGEPADEIHFFIRDSSDLESVNWKTISVESGIGEDWFEPPLNEWLDYNIDVAAIPINQKLTNFSELINNKSPNVETGSTAFDPEMIMHGDDIVSGGDVVLVIGYPDGLLDSDTYFPLLRNARISTPFGVAFQRQPKFITDAMMYPGMSGSPIVAGPRTLKNPATGGLRTSSRGFALLGIHSDNYQRPHGETVERLNLNAGWYAMTINTAIQESLKYKYNESYAQISEKVIDAYPKIQNVDMSIMKYVLQDIDLNQ